ncbi:L-ascorbate metabolism protein UlaG (beta-lactamase superfamily) [Isoptericola sp. CG 20/1183]|uniref:L-ascorbate metabolism protein UlaG (Beta-lactamase superfamily) n=1 Tax=Isoptericola halotolerans TaxID=300560 RepID=A0ABX5EB76_9MICO|nr:MULTISPECIES: MBL fold metallo-hydrolase [Isoptericola]PRZ04457.1 L-ascorbate metabolism protein UlaG (beta-lactamase superfamily) [Isoptericola halotolerans]PRZ04645.1 L-ascorbate metabolism protein UlaG (beta-lactamase superfamily) [Isoptericola sp. CG 20/1183]
MRLTFHGHACVSISGAGTRVVIDPGTLADARGALAGASGVLITHEHPDHLDVEAVVEALRGDATLTVRGTAGVVEALRDAGMPGERAQAAEPGEELELGAARVLVGGGDHAPIHPRLPLIANRTYTVALDGATVHHPGDSFDVPAGALDVLCLPVSGPWLRLSEVIDVTLAASARTVVPVHDALLSETGHQLTRRWLDTGRLGGEHVYRRLAAGESFEV